MQCPVCFTNTNEDICPNCGMTLKKGTSSIAHLKDELPRTRINPSHFKIKEELEKVKTIPNYKPATEKISLQNIILLAILGCVWAIIFSVLTLRRFL